MFICWCKGGDLVVWFMGSVLRQPLCGGGRPAALLEDHQEVCGADGGSLREPRQSGVGFL